jgi:hypothetical protein
MVAGSVMIAVFTFRPPYLNNKPRRFEQPRRRSVKSISSHDGEAKALVSVREAPT